MQSNQCFKTVMAYQIDILQRESQNS